MATTQEQLDAVQTAIAKVEAGAQEYYIDDRRVRYPELSVLYKREEALLSRLARENNPVFSVIQRDRP